MSPAGDIWTKANPLLKFYHTMFYSVLVFSLVVSKGFNLKIKKIKIY